MGVLFKTKFLSFWSRVWSYIVDAVIVLNVLMLLSWVAQEPGKMEAELARVDTAYLMKNILTTRKTGPPVFPKGEYGTGFNPDTPDTLPSWLTQQDLDYYVTKFEKSGFTGGLNYYRNLNLWVPVHLYGTISDVTDTEIWYNEPFTSVIYDMFCKNCDGFAEIGSWQHHGLE